MGVCASVRPPFYRCRVNSATRGYQQYDFDEFSIPPVRCMLLVIFSLKSFEISIAN